MLLSKFFRYQTLSIIKHVRLGQTSKRSKVLSIIDIGNIMSVVISILLVHNKEVFKSELKGTI